MSEEPGGSPRRPYRIIVAPSVLGLRPGGVERLADALLALGLAERLDATVAERLAPPAWQADRDADTLTLNAAAIASWTPRLADASSVCSPPAPSR
jgi:arginase